MSSSRIILSFPSRYVVGVVILSSLLSAWAIILELTPEVDNFLERVRNSYDSIVPEITLRDGKASIRERQPHYLSPSSDKDVTIVIDTRDMKQREAYEYIRQTPFAIAITRDFMVLKNHDQLSELSFKNLPDMVINSTTLLSAMNEYSSRIWFMAWIFFIFYCLLNKTAQVCLFAFIPMIVGKRLSAPTTYGESVKLTAAAMVIPVITDFFLSWIGILQSFQTIIYFAIFAVVLVRIIKDNIRNQTDDASSISAISPGV